MKVTSTIRKEVGPAIREWAREYSFGIFIFNIILMLLVLLRSAGYFDPFVPITINLIFFVSITMATVFLGFRSRGLFVLAGIFWILALVFRSLKIDIWAERAAIYVFEAVLVGVLLLILENINIRQFVGKRNV